MSIILTAQRASPSNSKSSLISVGSNLYSFTTLFNAISTNPEKLALFKSIDGGATWTEQDVAHEPLTTIPTGSPNVFVRSNAYLFGTIIRCIYIDNNTTIRVTDYNTSTDLWGTPSIAGPTPVVFTSAYAPAIAIASCLRNTGEVIVDYWSAQENVGGSNYTRVSRVRFSAGVWSAAQPFPNQTGNTICYVPAEVVADSTGRTSSLIHSWNTIFTATGVVSLIQVTYSNANAFVTTQTIKTPLYGGVNSNGASIWLDGFQTAKLNTQIDYNDGSEKLGIIIVIPLTILGHIYTKVQFGFALIGDTPVWTFEDVISATDSATFFSFTVGTNDFSLVFLSGSMYLLWTFGSDSLNRSVILCSVRTSSWSAAFFIWTTLWPYIAGYIFSTIVGSNIGILICSGDSSASEPTNALELLEYFLLTVAAPPPPSTNFFNIAY